MKYADHRDFDRSRSRSRSLCSKELRSLTDHEKVNAVHERRSPVHVHFDIDTRLHNTLEPEMI